MEQNNDKLLSLHSVNQLISAVFYIDLIIAVLGFVAGVYFSINGDLYGRGPVLLGIAIGSLSSASFFGGLYVIVNSVYKDKTEQKS